MADDYEQYFCWNLIIPLLDHLITELNTRFATNDLDNVVEFMQLLPSVIVKGSSVLSKDAFHNILKFYRDDLPSFVCVDSELDLWQHKWKARSELASTLDTPEKSLKHTDSDFFLNIYTLLQIIPVTSCECERSISMLKLIKSPLRSTMTQERLNGLAMLYYHRDIPLTPEEVVDEFARRNPRRMLLSNPVS